MLTVADFAAVRARLDAGEPLHAALEGSGVATVDWHGTQLQWLGTLGDALDNGHSQPLADYHAAYEREWEKVLGQRREIPIETSRTAEVFTPAPAVESSDEPGDLSGTGVLDVAMLGRPAVPFAGEGAEPPLAAGQLEPDTQLGDTAYLDAKILRALAASSLAQTHGLDVSMLNTAPVPFSGEQGPPAKAEWKIHPALGDTVEMDARHGPSNLGASSVLPTWTPDSYAVLVALTEGATTREEYDQALCDLGIKNDDHRRQIDDRMTALFDRDGQARRTFMDQLMKLRGEV